MGAMQPRVTIVDVARDAGVSIATVSAALNDRPGVSEPTRKRVVATAQQLGWSPSLRGRSLSQKRAFNVGLVIQRNPSVIASDPFFAGFISGVESVLEDGGYALVLQVAPTRQRTVERYRRLAADHRVDGVFLTDVSMPDSRFDLVRKLGIPAVAINAASRGEGISSVRQSHEPGIDALLAHLVDLGHRRIAHVCGPRDYIHAHDRERAWRDYLSAARIRPGACVEGDFSLAGGSRAAAALLRRKPRPTAVFCANDLMAIGFIAKATEMGFSVPGDVSVAGYDGIDFGAYARPSLTTVTTAPHALGEQAARTLLGMLDGKPASHVDTEPASLVVRASTGPLA
ncbi:LacI family DNA-binding transcriptional regulator [Angustibacter sp. McL0619]|uniref:LacI family DNA-binding transcriptional regulator n=1 Tax=Angustibacter sp. McL0619 TaxID=3415676 RepID=UPI003CF834A2